MKAYRNETYCDEFVAASEQFEKRRTCSAGRRREAVATEIARGDSGGRQKLGQALSAADPHGSRKLAVEPSRAAQCTTIDRRKRAPEAIRQGR